MSRSLVVAVHVPVSWCVIGNCLVGNHEVVAGVDGGCPVVYFGAGCHCSIYDYELGFVVVKSLP